jgi:hypothetical protein
VYFHVSLLFACISASIVITHVGGGGGWCGISRVQTQLSDAQRAASSQLGTLELTQRELAATVDRERAAESGTIGVMCGCRVMCVVSERGRERCVCVRA